MRHKAGDKTKISPSDLARLQFTEIIIEIDSGTSLQFLFEKYGHLDPFIEVHYDYDESGTYLTYRREETDEEYNTRISELKRIAKIEKDKIEARERAMYEKLKKKFEK